MHIGGSRATTVTSDRDATSQCVRGMRDLIADSALKDGQVQLSPTAAHISHSGGQPTDPQVSTRSGKHDTVR